MGRTNPELTDGAYYGPSRGHLQPRWAQHVGMPRGYGYGASMGAWIIDYVAAWAGEWGHVTYSSAQYRNPAFTGDATYIRSEEHTSELQSLMRISYAVFCLKKKNYMI